MLKKIFVSFLAASISLTSATAAFADEAAEVPALEEGLSDEEQPEPETAGEESGETNESPDLSETPAPLAALDESDTPDTTYVLDSVVLEETSYAYRGKTIEPVPIVYGTLRTTDPEFDPVTLLAADAGSEKVQLTEGTDYEVTYDNNVSVGTGTVYVVGINDYDGQTLSADFTITPVLIENAALKYSKMVYSGKKRTQTGETVVTANISGKECVLTRTADYTIRYSDNINVGTATMTITGKGNFTGKLTRTFEIAPRSVKKAEVTVRNAAYTGNARKPKVTVRYNGKTLKKDRDYTVAYNNNVNVGTAAVKVTGTGNFRGTVTKEFKICKSTLEDAKIKLNQTKYTYDGTKKKPGVKYVKLAGKTLQEGVDYKVSYLDNKNAGTATVKVKGMGNYKGTALKTFTIKSANISGASVTLSKYEYTYSGKQKKPKVKSVILRGKTLTEGTDYTVSYKDNVEEGENAKVIVTGKGNYTGKVTERFTINPDLTIITIPDEDIRFYFDMYLDLYRYAYMTIDEVLAEMEEFIRDIFVSSGDLTERDLQRYMKEFRETLEATDPLFEFE